MIEQLHVFVTGGTGFIGRHIVRDLQEAGHQVTVLSRSGRAPKLAKETAVIRGDFNHPEPWLPRLEQFDVVINSVGIIRERHRLKFTQLHAAAPIQLFAAASRFGVKHIIQISALGADQPRPVTPFLASKKRADDYLRSLSLPHTILYPSIVYGPGDMSMNLFKKMARFPIVPVLGDGKYRLQPVHVDDLARAVSCALMPEKIKQNRAVAVVGPEPIQFGDLIDLLGKQQGRNRTPKLFLPLALMRPIIHLLSPFSFAPINKAELKMLEVENIAAVDPFVAEFGFMPQDLSAAAD